MELNKITNRKLKTAADLLKAISHPARLKILCSLSHNSMNVGEMAEKLELSQSMVSQQLKILKTHELVKSVRIDGFSVHSIHPKKKESLKALLGGICSCIEE
jgi:DNA-binding transcriptional ArsR family regulator